MRKVDNHGLMGFLCAVFDLTRLGFAVFKMRVFSDKSGIFCRAIRGSWLTPPLSPKRFQLFCSIGRVLLAGQLVLMAVALDELLWGLRALGVPKAGLFRLG